VSVRLVRPGQRHRNRALQAPSLPPGGQHGRDRRGLVLFLHSPHTPQSRLALTLLFCTPPPVLFPHPPQLPSPSPLHNHDLGLCWPPSRFFALGLRATHCFDRKSSHRRTQELLTSLSSFHRSAATISGILHAQRRYPQSSRSGLIPNRSHIRIQALLVSHRTYPSSGISLAISTNIVALNLVTFRCRQPRQPPTTATCPTSPPCDDTSKRIPSDPVGTSPRLQIHILSPADTRVPAPFRCPAMFRSRLLRLDDIFHLASRGSLAP